MKAILGRKVGMTQVFATDGTILPVTVVEVLPNVVMQKKTLEKDGYEAVQLGYEDKKEKNATKAELGHAAKANTTPKQFVREVKGDEMNKYNVGDVVTVDIFQAGELVDVTAKTKGFFLPYFWLASIAPFFAAFIISMPPVACTLKKFAPFLITL